MKAEVDQADPQVRWIEQAKQGDLDAQGVLLLACHEDLLRHVTAKMPAKLRKSHAPEDFLHDTYKKAIANLDRFEYRGPGSFLGWLKLIATRTLIDANRKAKPPDLAIDPIATPGDASSCDGVINNLPGSSKGPSTKSAQEELRRAFHVALAKLSGDHQRVIKLRYLQELSLEEVAERLQKSEAAVRGLCHRARIALRDHMDRLSRFI